MLENQTLHFGPYRFDLHHAQLWRGKQGVRLTAKALAALQYLVERPGQLVTKDELFAAVWPEVVVGDPALTVCIGRLRKVLRDNAKKPQYIETVHRQGYRFIGQVQRPEASVPHRQGEPQSFTLKPRHATLPPVGREAELAQLGEWLERARSGERQVVFVTGEAGIGKTTLVETFLEQLSGRADLWVARGQCIEHHGTGEAYLPVLEAVGRLCRESGSEQVVEILGRHAPTWLAQLAGVLEGEELEALQRRVVGTTKERMLREMAEAIEHVTTDRTLVLRFEDLQWSDYSSLDLISYLARRPQHAQVLLIGVYRPLDVILSMHPLREIKQDLQVHGQCQELPLELLTEDDVARYLAARFPIQTALLLDELTRYVYRRTEGNPLFMLNVVDDLVRRAVIARPDGRWQLVGELEAVETPVTLRQFIEQEVERLNPEAQRALETASVAGMEFSAAAVAAALGETVETVEKQYTELARREQFVYATGVSEWPDGTLAARYEFIHAVYQETLYERVVGARRTRLHQQLGERIEVAYGARVAQVAAELAVHFERSRDYQRAVQYLRQAGENAIRRSAYQDAIALLTQGLELLTALPDTPERSQSELRLHMALSTPLIATKGYAAPEVEQLYNRVWELCQHLDQTPQLFSVLGGLCSFYYNRAELQTALSFAQQQLRLAQSTQDLRLLLWAYYGLGSIEAQQGDLIAARAHFEQGLALYDPKKQATYGWAQDPGGSCLARLALTLWLTGSVDQALQRSQEALTLARELKHPFTLAYVLNCVGIGYLLRREWSVAQEVVEELIALAHAHGFVYALAGGVLMRGRIQVAQGQPEEGISQIRRGLAAHQRAGTALWRPSSLALLAEACGQAEQADEGLSSLAEALDTVNKTGEHWYEVELYRLKGQLTLQQQLKIESQKLKVPNTLYPTPSPQAQLEAEACFLKATEIARQQNAKSLELRATTSLARLWQAQGKNQQAQTMLAEIYNWFTEGFDTADLKAAKALLEAKAYTDP